MSIALFRAKPSAARVWTWAQARPAPIAVAMLLVVYAGYLPNSGFHRLYYDSSQYWELGRQYGKTGAFELLSFGSSMRGYLLPLLLAPFAIAGPHIGWEPVDLMRPLGVATAALLFGALGPALWRAAVGAGAPEVSLSRRLVFGALGFVLWRDYFNFPLSDFPALCALATALWAILSGRSVLSGVLAGLALGASANMRPVFMAALPFAGLLALLPRPAATDTGSAPTRRMAWAWRGGIAAGLAMVLAPQVAINAHNAGVYSPWVLARVLSNPTNLYMQQLEWGLQFQKYETNVGSDLLGAQMFFLDPNGAAVFASAHLLRFDNLAQYLALAKQQPLAVLGVWARHLFNGLDLQYPSPYIKKVYVVSWPLAWLNYTVLLGGTVVLLTKAWRSALRLRPWLVLATLLMPCLGALPVAMECRFLLPLHLLLSAAVAFGAQPLRSWRAAAGTRRVALVAGYILLVAAAFWVSSNCKSRLDMAPRNLLGTAAL